MRVFILLLIVFTLSMISKNIQGAFKGWKGNTTVKLNDGSIWQQDERLNTSCYQYNPEVELEYIQGSYRIKVSGCDNNWVKVKQVKKAKFLLQNKFIIIE